VPAREDHPERGEVMEDEREVSVAGEERGEVDEVCGEVGSTVVEHEVLEVCVCSGKAAAFS